VIYLLDELNIEKKAIPYWWLLERGTKCFIHCCLRANELMDNWLKLKQTF
jgi:hypothetical protein